MMIPEEKFEKRFEVGVEGIFLEIGIHFFRPSVAHLSSIRGCQSCSSFSPRLCLDILPA